ncbi:MAG: AGE family epimerase/isomerase [Bacteroidales bacterium]|nr:AGE family epimerase/isomerase [Bacteroidales bacterium]
MKIKIRNRLILLLNIGILLTFAGVSCSSDKQKDQQKLIDELEYSLKSELLDVWYPSCLDTVYGGYLSDFSSDWHPDGPQQKMIVAQARLLWTASEAALMYNNKDYQKYAAHGVQFLREKMWDNHYGGFYMYRNREGEDIGGANAETKSAYGNAFAIYALSSYYKLSADTAALELAKKTFYWLDRYSHDPEFKGYFNLINRDGSWLVGNSLDESPMDITPVGWKDQNSSIHLLEAFTNLYQVWPDSLLRERLIEMKTIIRDTLIGNKGYLTLFATRDWKPVSFRDSSEDIRNKSYHLDHVSFGHDVETAYLLLEASHTLGLDHDKKTLEVAKRMVDHSLNTGWDNQRGGFYYEGYYFKDSDTLTIIDDSKNWWVQSEGLNALLLMSELFPDEEKYYTEFLKQWNYIKTYLIDHKNGEWYDEGLDNSPERQSAPKASVWKLNYHNGRALMNCIKMLRSEHELTADKS